MQNPTGNCCRLRLQRWCELQRCTRPVLICTGEPPKMRRYTAPFEGAGMRRHTDHGGGMELLE